jgi:hypothetical protein
MAELCPTLGNNEKYYHMFRFKKGNTAGMNPRRSKCGEAGAGF